MLKRKIAELIEEHLRSDSERILLIDGARQVGKTYIIRHVGKRLLPNFIEINMLEDSIGDRLFENAKTIDDFYLRVSAIKGELMGEAKDTLIFIDEIQAYPHLLTMLKFLRDDNRFTYIASGSLLGVTLAQTTSIPIGSIRKVRMFPLDFEEFLYANGMNAFAIDALRKKFEAQESLDEAMHAKIMDTFKRYLLVGGLPAAVNAYLDTKNIQAVRSLGIRVMLDDFGMGYTTFHDLLEFPMDGLKLDKSLVDRLSTEPGKIVLGGIIDTAHKLGLSVLAEGVEEEWQVDELRRMGCDLLQGYLFSIPLPASEAMRRITGRGNRPEESAKIVWKRD